MSRRAVPAILVLVVATAGACSSGDDRPPRPSDAGRTRRVIEPPPGHVRPLPPHAIDPGGIGPYRLGVSQAEVFAVLPSIPRVAILDVDRVLDASVVRTEEEQLLVGGRPGEPISFIAALSPGIARTDTGLAVGARRAELARLGAAVSDPRVARDPRIVIPAAMPGASFLFDGDRVAAILLEPVAGEVPTAPTSPTVDAGSVSDAGAVAAGCTATLIAGEDELVTAAMLKGPGRVMPACLTVGGHEALVVVGETVAIVDGDHDKLRRITWIELPGLVWAAPLRTEPDRDDLVAVIQRRDKGELVVSLIALRLEGGRLSRVGDEQAFRLTETNAQWLGARLDDLRLLIEVSARPDGFGVGGVLIHTTPTGVRDVAPLLPVSVARRRARSTPEGTSAAPTDAGVTDATAAHPDAGKQRDAGADAAP